MYIDMCPNSMSKDPYVLRHVSEINATLLALVFIWFGILFPFAFYVKTNIVLRLKQNIPDLFPPHQPITTAM